MVKLNLFSIFEIIAPFLILTGMIYENFLVDRNGFEFFKAFVYFLYLSAIVIPCFKLKSTYESINEIGTEIRYLASLVVIFLDFCQLFINYIFGAYFTIQILIASLWAFYNQKRYFLVQNFKKSQKRNPGAQVFFILSMVLIFLSSLILFFEGILNYETFSGWYYYLIIGILCIGLIVNITYQYHRIIKKTKNPNDFYEAALYIFGTDKNSAGGGIATCITPKGLLVTAYHCIEGRCKKLENLSQNLINIPNSEYNYDEIILTHMNSRIQCKAKIISKNPDGDIAVLRIQSENPNFDYIAPDIKIDHNPSFNYIHFDYDRWITKHMCVQVPRFFCEWNEEIDRNTILLKTLNHAEGGDSGSPLLDGVNFKIKGILSSKHKEEKTLQFPLLRNIDKHILDIILREIEE